MSKVNINSFSVIQLDIFAVLKQNLALKSNLNINNIRLYRKLQFFIFCIIPILVIELIKWFDSMIVCQVDLYFRIFQ